MSRIVLVLVLITFAVSFAGCGREESVDGAGREAQLTAEERLEKAKELFVAAASAAKPKKIDLYEQIIGFYPESPYAEHAHFLLIQVLHGATVARHDDALEQTRSFAERHPTSAKVAEAWHWMANHWSDDAGPARAVRDEWRAYLKKTRARDDLDPSTKARIWLESSYAACWDGDKEAGLGFLEAALPWEIEDKRTELEIAFRAGSLQSDLGKKAAAKASFEKALTLAMNGAKGANVESIRAQIAALGH